MCTCACVPEHAHGGDASAPKAGPSKQKRHEGALWCIVDEDAEGFSNARSRSASSGTAVPTGARAPARRTSAPSRAAHRGAARARRPRAPRRRAPRRGAPRRTADAPSKTGRPGRAPTGKRARGEGPSSGRIRRACSERARRASKMRSRMPGAHLRSAAGDPAKCTCILVAFNPRFGNAFFLTKATGVSTWRWRQSRYVRHSLNHVTRVPTAVHPSTPRGAFSFWRDTSRIEPPSRARATVAPTFTPQRQLGSALRSLGRALVSRSARAQHVGAGTRVRPLRSAGCD